MLTLYHGRTSVCAIKARLTLAEKGLDWDSNLMTLGGDQFDPAYMKLNPNAVVPTVVHDGNVIIESTVIMHYLNDAFPEPALMPTDPVERSRVHMTTKLMDEYVHNSCTVLTFATAYRQRLASLTPEERKADVARSPSKQRSDAKLQVAEMGMEAPLVIESIKNHEKLLTRIEDAMSVGSWIAGNSYSLADVAATPYIWRLDCLRLSKMWDKRPGVAEWYDRIRARPSFETAIEDWVRDKELAAYKAFQPDPWPKVQEILAAA